MERDSDEDTPTWCDRFHQRYVIVIILFMVVAYSFASENALTVALFYTVELDSPSRGLTENCPNLAFDVSNQTVSENTNKTPPYRWHGMDSYDHITRYHFVGNSIGLVIGGYLADTRGAKHVTGASLMANSIMNFLTPVMFKGTHGSPVAIGVLRLLEGICVGMIIPAVTTLLSHWVPLRERAFLSCLTFGGIFLGIGVGLTISHDIAEKSGDWTLPCYVSGGLGISICFIWMIFGYSDPRECPKLYPVERLYLQRELGNTVGARKKTVPLSKILSSLDVWALIIGSIGHLWHWYFTIPFLTNFIESDLKVQMSEFSYALPYIMMIVCSVIFGAFSDWTTRNEYISLTTARKVFTNIGTAGPAIYAVAAIFGGCNRILVQINVVISLGLAGSVHAGIRLVPMDLSPNYSGILSGMTDFIGGFIGFIYSEILNGLAPDRTLDQFKTVLLISLGIAIISNIVFVLLGGTNIKGWNYPKAVRARKRE